MAAQVQPLPAASTLQHEERRRIVDSALGTTLAEGVSPGPEALALSERFIAGEITLAQFGSLMRKQTIPYCLLPIPCLTSASPSAPPHSQH